MKIQPLAKELGVATAAIYVKFRGGGEIATEMFRLVLADVARPLHPNETWESYLRALFTGTFDAFKGRGRLALALGSELSENYFLNPHLPERILHALELAGVPENDKAKALDLVIANLIGFMAVQRTSLGESETAEWLKDQSNLIDNLPSAEYPQIKARKVLLIKAAKERAEQLESSTSAPKSVLRFADVLIEGLKGRFGAKASELS
ncbi:hypothetical protein [Hyphomicrobium sp. 802]|uniref:hypothetical protein n=1 Tax=Hyphomicrobium sp. 802 TaxID=1112272 RepID=UPI0004ADD906|nr:hypothetical protein [Hyphomicrobium sp. 802]